MGDIPYNGIYRWSEIIDAGRQISEISDQEFTEHRAESVEFDDTLNINIQYTSGTTVYPKGVVLSHHSILNNGLIIGDGMKFTENDKLCIPVPFYHCFGMLLSSNMACMTHGTNMFIEELEHLNFSCYDLSSLCTGIMAGSPCLIERMREVSEKINMKVNMKEIVIVYGLTETTPGITMFTTDYSLEQRVTTVGRVFPYTELVIMDPKTG